MDQSARTIIVLAAVASAAACAYGPRSASQNASTNSFASITDGFPPAVREDVERLRNATDAYHDVKVAQAAGYPTAVPACVQDSSMGGMGRHYLNRAFYEEKTPDIAHPEMLIYAPSPGGQPDHLVGVEYAIPFRLLASTEKPPRLFGQEFKRHEEFKYWYLHVWAWQKNSAGLFSDWSPAIKC